VLATAGGKYLVNSSTTNRVYLSSERCPISSDAIELVTAPSNHNDAKMVLAGDGNFYIAIRNGTSLNYYKVSGNTVSGISLSPNPTLYQVTNIPMP
jgi:hypothetical protein